MPRITWRAIAIAAAALVLAPAAGARADAVADWNRIALNSVLESRQSTPEALNTLATVHAAMFESLNFIEARYMPRYVVEQPSPLAMPGDAAVAAAAQYVLAEAYPDRRVALDKELHASLEPIDGDRAVSTTEIVGRNLATIVWIVRARASSAPAAPIRAAPAINPQAWDRVVDLVASKSLRPIEKARIYALISIAADESMTAASRIGRTSPQARATRPCAPCAVQAAVDAVLRLEFGSDGFADSLPSLVYPDSQAIVQVNFVGGPDDSVAAGEQLGARIARHVSRTFYGPRNE
jgi:hypothetical protein